LARAREDAHIVTPTSRPIVFSSDFGYRNEWVGICHAVMARIAPDSRIVDLSHGLPPLNVMAAARLLVDSLAYVASDAVLVSIVDPSVGADRDVAIEAHGGRLLVGPDNGLLVPACQTLGGVERAVEITSAEVVLEPVSPSFHARDILCPAAAYLAAGMELEQLGPAIDAATLTPLDLPEPLVEAGKIECEVIDLNRFGNAQLNVRQANLTEAVLDSPDQLEIRTLAASTRARRAKTYADLLPDEYGLMFDPRGWLSLIRGNPGNAAAGLGLQMGDLVWLGDPRHDE
jgi:S-adenosyl-L-methionine hydrolase (adenosine-forming)